jgi:hypothetical protein
MGSHGTGSHRSAGTTYDAGTSGTTGNMGTGTGSTTGTGSAAGTGYDASGTTRAEGGEGMMDRARDAVSDLAGRAGDMLSDAADAAGDLAGRARDAMGGTVPAVGAVVGALAATVGGWWAMHAGKDTDVREEDERSFRSHFDSHPARSTGRVTYDDARTGYALGHTAARNPSYTGRGFDEVEPELRAGFRGEHAGSYDTLRDFTRYGYEHGTGRTGTGGTGGTGGGTGGMGTGHTPIGS